MTWYIIIFVILVICSYFVIADLVKHNGELDFNHAITNQQIKWFKSDKYDRIKIGKNKQGEEYEEILFFDNSYKEKIFAGYLSFDILPEHQKLPNIYYEQITFSGLHPAINEEEPMQTILFFKLIGKNKEKIITNSPNYIKTITPLDNNYQPIITAKKQ